MKLRTLVDISKKASKISEFVLGNGLKDSIASVTGDIHLDAAKLALESSKFSVAPEDRIKSVITHLEASHIAYSRIHKNVNNFIARNHHPFKFYVAVAKDAWICCLMAICYKYLADEPMVIYSISLAKKAFENHPGNYDESVAIALAGGPLGYLSMFDPSTWGDVSEYNNSFHNGGICSISEHDIEKIRKNLTF